MAKDIMKTQACITGIITADENDVKQLQLHTHKVQAKSTCKFGAHDKRLACLGVEEYSGKNAERSRKELPETVLSRRGLFMCKGKVVIFSSCKHGANDSIETGSTK